jgi:hypothetical protein
MRLRLSIGLALIVAACAAVVVPGASARFQPNSVVPLFCTSDTIPGGTQLSVRIRWVVRNSGQIDKFLSSQLLTWTVYDSSNNVLASRTPATYGDRTGWSAPVHSNTVDMNNDGVIDDVWYADYLMATGVTVATGETVRIAHSLTANAKTDDGFGFRYNAGDTISSGSNCSVTGV